MARPARSAFLLLCFLPASCSVFRQEAELSVTIPSPPGHWVHAFPDLHFDLVFPDSGGRWQRRAVTDPLQPTVISCSKEGNAPVLAYPVAERAQGLLRPAGGLSPPGCVDQGTPPHLALSWEEGPLALVFKTLTGRRFDTSRVNAQRLASCFKRHADPWALDLVAIAEKLIQGDFSAYDIDALPARQVALRPGAGQWFLESPFSSPGSVGDGDLLIFPSLGLGTHALFSADGRRIMIWVGAEETVIGPLEQTVPFR